MSLSLSLSSSSILYQPLHAFISFSIVDISGLTLSSVHRETSQYSQTGHRNAAEKSTAATRPDSIRAFGSYNHMTLSHASPSPFQTSTKHQGAKTLPVHKRRRAASQSSLTQHSLPNVWGSPVKSCVMSPIALRNLGLMPNWSNEDSYEAKALPVDSNQPVYDSENDDVLQVVLDGLSLQ